jgi:hypothetical protein
MICASNASIATSLTTASTATSALSYGSAMAQAHANECFFYRYDPVKGQYTLQKRRTPNEPITSSDSKSEPRPRTIVRTQKQTNHAKTTTRAQGSISAEAKTEPQSAAPQQSDLKPKYVPTASRTIITKSVTTCTCCVCTPTGSTTGPVYCHNKKVVDDSMRTQVPQNACLPPKCGTKKTPERNAYELNEAEESMLRTSEIVDRLRASPSASYGSEKVITFDLGPSESRNSRNRRAPHRPGNSRSQGLRFTQVEPSLFDPSKRELVENDRSSSKNGSNNQNLEKYKQMLNKTNNKQSNNQTNTNGNRASDCKNRNDNFGDGCARSLNSDNAGGQRTPRGLRDCWSRSGESSLCGGQARCDTSATWAKSYDCDDESLYKLNEVR